MTNSSNVFTLIVSADELEGTLEMYERQGWTLTLQRPYRTIGQHTVTHYRLELVRVTT